MAGENISQIRQKTRKFFQWQHSNWFIGVFWTGALGVLAIAVTVNEAANIAFDLAYVFFSLALFWTLGWWLTSDTLQSYDPRTWPKKKRKRSGIGGVALQSPRKTRIVQRRFRFIQWAITLLIIGLFALAVWATHATQILVELSRLEGWLYPASEAIPSSPCDILLPAHPESLFVYLGQFIGGSDRFPHTVLSVHGKDRLILDKRSDGSLAISLDILSGDGKIIARIERGRFIVNQNNYLTMKRRDRSSLIVVDQFGVEVLNARYLNKRAIWINAVLRYPGTAPIIIRGSQSSEANCIFGSGKADIAIE